MSELNKLTLAEARDALRAGDVTSVELTDACLTEIDGAGALNAFVHHTPEIARTQAAAADARIKAGDAPAMCGLPIGIKDLFCTKGVPSQAGSRILEGFLPEYESTVSQTLFDAGDARERRRLPDRATGVRARCGQAQVRRHGRCRPAGRPTRGQRAIIDLPRVDRIAINRSFIG